MWLACERNLLGDIADRQVQYERVYREIGVLSELVRRSLRGPITEAGHVRQLELERDSLNGELDDLVEQLRRHRRHRVKRPVFRLTDSFDGPEDEQ